jgi:hypothetical protein
VAGVEHTYSYLAPSAVMLEPGRAEVARTRYYEPPQMVAARIRAADPVVTSNVDRLRFESFSACAGVYARLDLDPDSLDGAPAEWGRPTSTSTRRCEQPSLASTTPTPC